MGEKSLTSLCTLRPQKYIAARAMTIPADAITALVIVRRRKTNSTAAERKKRSESHSKVSLAITTPVSES